MLVPNHVPLRRPAFCVARGVVAGYSRRGFFSLTGDRLMIRDYTDHAANERTFLAWVRTGIAVIAFGFVIEKFNLFVLTILSSTSVETAHQLRLDKVSGPIGRYGGPALIIMGLLLIIVSTARFIHTGRLLNDTEVHSATNARFELAAAVVLVLLVAGLSVYLGLGQGTNLAATPAPATAAPY